MSGRHPGLCPGCDEEKLLRDDVNICEECMERHRELSRIDPNHEGSKLIKRYANRVDHHLPTPMRCAVITVSQDEYDLMWDATPAIMRFAPEALIKEGYQSLIIRPYVAITVAPREGVDEPRYLRDYTASLKTMEAN